ncbi:esterase [Marinilongibacter aquaticus]|uniref:alpha/beta hydrolase-fold protein n=1 Tax=Marinilongibacter aquaticus TaxID=2975157 RepID=UPI0021BDBD5B|nr:alpha/beta hydrolase-fold protein [Marinilongibacter aquaticus]UBM59266.1 esterase [Marinilongibacter aquaticus]
MNRSVHFAIYGHWGKPLLLFPTSMGRAWQMKDFGLIDTVAERVNAGQLKIYALDSIDMDSFYGRHLPSEIKISNYQHYVQFIHEEFLPMIQSQCNVHRIGIGGCSFGAYHAANFAFNYPDLINYLIAMSGSYNIKNFLGDYYDYNVYRNSPLDFLPNHENWTYNHMRIILGTSDWDICRNDTLTLSALLGKLQIQHQYDEKKWIAHDWPLWNMAFPEYLSSVL